MKKLHHKKVNQEAQVEKIVKKNVWRFIGAFLEADPMRAKVIIWGLITLFTSGGGGWLWTVLTGRPDVPTRPHDDIHSIAIAQQQINTKITNLSTHLDSHIMMSMQNQKMVLVEIHGILYSMPEEQKMMALAQIKHDLRVAKLVDPGLPETFPGEDSLDGATP